MDPSSPLNLLGRILLTTDRTDRSSTTMPFRIVWYNCEEPGLPPGITAYEWGRHDGCALLMEYAVTMCAVVRAMSEKQAEQLLRDKCDVIQIKSVTRVPHKSRDPLPCDEGEPEAREARRAERKKVQKQRDEAWERQKQKRAMLKAQMQTIVEHPMFDEAVRKVRD